MFNYSDEDKKYIEIGHLIKQHRYSKALSVVNKAIIKYPKSIMALNLKGTILSKFRDYEAALTVYEKAMKLNPVVNTGLKLNSIILYKKGIMLENLHRYKDAIKCYNKYMRLPNKMPLIVVDIKERKRKK